MMLKCLVLAGIISFGANSQSSNNTKPDEKDRKIVELKQLVNEMSKMTEIAKNNVTRAAAEVANYKAKCSSEIQYLDEKKNELMATFKGNQKTMGNLLEAIIEEEETQKKLLGELERLISLLELLEVQRTVVNGDVMVASARRTNHTSPLCYEANQGLRDMQVEVQKMASRYNRFRRPTGNKSRIDTRDREINRITTAKVTAEILHKQLVDQADTLERQLAGERSLCETNKKHAIDLMEQTASAVETSEEDVLKMTNDLKVTVEFSESVRLEIKTAKEHVKESNYSLLKMKLVLADDYVEDNRCYSLLRSVA